MRISDWSSDVCSSDLADPGARVEVFIDDEKVGDTGADAEGRWTMRPEAPVAPGSYQLRVDKVAAGGTVEARVAFPFELGRASCRDRVCQYVSIPVVAVSLKKQNNSKHR